MSRITSFFAALIVLAPFVGRTQNRSFRPGAIWGDNNGVHINAHGGGILLMGDVYYWYGEHKIEGEAGNRAHVGVHCYSSKDLYNWKDEGIALSVVNQSGHDIEKGCILERPKVIFNEKTGKYVMWFHLELKGKGYDAARTGVAIADSPAGPFAFVKSFRPNKGVWPVNAYAFHKEQVGRDVKDKYCGGLGCLPAHVDSVNILGRDFKNGQMARDMNLFVDDDGKAYHIYSSEENSTLHISQLTDDYLSYSGRYARAFPNRYMEAPAMFKCNGKYYLIASGCTGWRPNAARSAVADNILGPWIELGNPCRGANANLTFHSQSTYVLPVNAEKGEFIFMGDRWTPENAIDGRYIWLPLTFENDEPVIRWEDEWSLADFSQQHKGAVTFTDTIKKTDGSNWWMGIIGQGHRMPFAEDLEFETWGAGFGNQVQPLILSDRGDVLWSEEPLRVENSEHELMVGSRAEITISKAGKSLKDAYLYASRNYFPPSGKMPDELLFTSPQYNTWIELMYDQNQKDILRYAHDIKDNGYPAGVLMIDDNWQEDYGKWNFHQGRFEHPKAMVDELHQMGYKVMLWVCPFVSPDCDVYRELKSKGYFLKNKAGQPAMVPWWNGVSALLDLSNPKAKKWFTDELQRLVDDYGVDGFKLDAGDARFYSGDVELNGLSPNDHSKLYGEIGLAFPLNEYRAMWKMGGQPLAERLHDKNHSWEHLNMLIPQMLVEGIMGYPFSCPDMIGGGQYKSFLAGAVIDQELIVRSAQCHALMPMMQFSVAPWRILDKQHLEAVKSAVDLRQKHKEYILELARKSAKTGEPIMRPMEYNFPNEGYAKIHDQFMLGDEILVAPVVNKGARTRDVQVPEGKWKLPSGEIIKGGKTLKFDVKLDELLYLRKVQ
ncbi:MAG: family 43 glycosylhydrolase [Cytophagales bacterium]|nr:family 43 glycosylhydrolase [Cytophagales bacterium]